jgi:hypothetical protein
MHDEIGTRSVMGSEKIVWDRPMCFISLDSAFSAFSASAAVQIS